MEPSIDIPAAAPGPNGASTPLAPQQLAPAACPTCGSAAAYSFVFAVGRIEVRFASPGVEKELAQVIARAPGKGKTDREAMQSVLSLRENRYLARQMCWVLTIQGLETYLLVPRDPADIELLVGALRSAPRPTARASGNPLRVAEIGPDAGSNVLPTSDAGGAVYPVTIELCHE